MKDHTFKARSTRILIGRKWRWWWEFKDFFDEENHLPHKEEVVRKQASRGFEK
jgi:hypothetical protein